MFGRKRDPDRGLVSLDVPAPVPAIPKSEFRVYSVTRNNVTRYSVYAFYADAEHYLGDTETMEAAKALIQDSRPPVTKLVYTEPR